MQTHFQIKQLSNKELLTQTKSLVQKERNLHIRILHHLREIDSRKLYFEMGFSSLFDYTVRELGYSEGAAYRRIKAMKLCQELPETENRLQSGRLTLSAASQLQVFFEKQDKKARKEQKQTVSVSLKNTESINNPEEQISPKKHSKKFFFEETNKNKSSKPFSLLKKKELINKVEGHSTRATMKFLSELDPSFSPEKEKVRFLGKGKVEIKIVIDEDCHKQLEELKHLLSHKNPSLSYGELVSILSDEALRKQDPRRRKTRQNHANSPNELKAKQSCKKELVKKLGASSGLVASEGREVASAQKLVAAKRIKCTAGQKLITSKKEGITSAPNLDALGKEKMISPQKLIISARRERNKKIINRTIPSYLRKYVWERDKGQCAYVNHETKRRCSSRHLLQIDHIQPFSLNGETEPKNLRLLCAGHNRFRSEKFRNK